MSNGVLGCGVAAGLVLGCLFSFGDVSPPVSGTRVQGADPSLAPPLAEILDPSLLEPPREQAGPSSRRHGLVISEVMYHPLESGGGEFLEILNTQVWAQDLSGWRISGEVDFAFPPGTTVAPGNSMVVAAEPVRLMTLHGLPSVLGPFEAGRQLSNRSGTLRLHNAQGAVVFEMTYTDRPPFPVAADGGGHSLVLARPSYGEADPRAWAASDFIGGDPLGVRLVEATGEVVVATRVVPPEGGNLTGAGNYARRSEVRLEATAAPGFRFLHWSENGEVLSASLRYEFEAAHDAVLLATFIPEPLEDEAFVRTHTLGNARNNFSGWIGMRLTVGPAPLYVTELGRYSRSDNQQTHRLRLVRVSDLTDVPGGHITVDAANGSNQIRYAPLLGPVLLEANTQYYLVSEETAGGDHWHDLTGTVLETTAVASVDAAAYQGSGFPWTLAGGAQRCYGPVGLRYATNPVPDLVRISLTATPPQGGTVTGGGLFPVGTEVQIRATPLPGFVFGGWTENGISVGAGSVLQFDATQDRILVARFLNPWSSARINEVLAAPGAGQHDFIELQNLGPESVDLNGCFLTDDPERTGLQIQGTLAPGAHRAWDETELGFGLSAAGESVFLFDPGRTRVLDAVQFGMQSAGLSFGRFPDGAPEWSVLDAPTPGSANARVRRPAIVINEVMFDPISGDSADEYIELYNPGPDAVDVGGWQLREAVDFTIPPGGSMAGGSYLIVARDATRLRSSYAQLSHENCIGNFSGRLSNRGDRILLQDAQGALVDEVPYQAGGAWGRWVSEGGSSLELRDPRADGRRAANWAGSDESASSSWMTVEATGTMDHGVGEATQLHVTLLGAGEALIDDVEVVPSTEENLVGNGGFEAGTAGWVFQGNHNQSRWHPGDPDQAGTLRLVASGRGDSGANRVRTQLSRELAPGSRVTLRARARWLAGNPNLLLRLRGNWMEAHGYILTNERLGTPGLANSQSLSNVGPSISDVRHHPVLPKAGEPVRVLARIDDVDELGGCALSYRLDPSSPQMDIPMTHHGAGLFSALLPGQGGGVLAAFQISARDDHPQPAMSHFPASGGECLVRWGDIDEPGSLGTYRLWISQTNLLRWAGEEKMSNNPKDLTFVCGGTRAIYGAGGAYHGSPYHSPDYTSPVGRGCDYSLVFPADERFLGAAALNLLRPGNDGSDATGQAEIHGYWAAEQLDLPFAYHRPVFVYVNGQRRGVIMQDAQQPNGDFVEQWYGEEGALHRVAAGFEFGDSGSNSGEPGFTYLLASLARFQTDDAQPKLARYRQTFPRRSAPVAQQNDYSRLLELVEAVNTAAPLGSAEYSQALREATDVDQWMRVHVAEHVFNHFDSWSYGGSQNAYLFKPPTAPWQLLMWDIDYAFSRSPELDNLQTLGGIDHGPAAAHPAFGRLYWQGLEEAALGLMSPAQSDPILDARYQGLVTAGAGVQSPQPIKNFMAVRRALILAQTAARSPAFGILTNQSSPPVTGEFPAVILGTGPLAMRQLLVNGVAQPVTWMDLATWRVELPLAPGLNEFVLAAADKTGAAVPGATRTARIEYTGPALWPPLLAIRQEGEILQIEWPSVPGRLYRLESKRNLEDAQWMIEGSPVVAAGRQMILRISLEPGGRAFYRVAE